MRPPQILSMALLFLSFSSLGLVPLLPAQTPSVLTRQYDNQHTGQNLQETILTPTNVNSGSFGKVFSYPVDGQIWTQPLYVPNVNVGTKGTHNVVYVATENAKVYAFDADSAKKNPNPLWFTDFLTPPNVLAVPCDIGAGLCQLFPLVGITQTPVINLANNTMYVVVRTQETAGTVISYVERLHALDITSGLERPGSPVVICSAVGDGGCSFGGPVMFIPKVKQGRPGLLLVNEPGFSQGVLFMGFAGATGWVLAYDASTLQLVASFYANDGITRSGHGYGGIWGAGGAVVADSTGNVYVVTADGYFDGIINWGDSLIKLVLTLNSSTGTYSLVPADYFTPSDEACRFTNGLDLGSAGPLILPAQGGTTPDLIFQGGKAATICDPTPSIYIVNRDNMGHLGGQVSLSQTAKAGTASSPAYWASATANYIYNGADSDSLRAYTVSSSGVSTASVLQTGNTFLNGSSPTVSANGTSNGIVWALDRTDNADILPGVQPVVLHAYNGTSLSELYNSTQAGSGRDIAGPSVKFQVPTVVNGKVYVGTQTELDVYGLCPCPQ
jgi:hypothetical protein